MSERTPGTKHFNLSNVYGKVLEVKEDTTDKGKPYLQITVDVSGSRTGSARAFCRMWGEQAIREFLEHFRKANGSSMYHFKGEVDQYLNRDLVFLTNFKVFGWEPTTAEKRAVFILKAEVTSATGTTDGGQRLLVTCHREGKEGYQDSTQELELFCQGEKLLDEVTAGDLIEVKGMIRQAEVDDFFGGGDGPIRAYVEKLKVHQAIPF